jgi:hypothetical protein
MTIAIFAMLSRWGCLPYKQAESKPREPEMYHNSVGKRV